MFQKKNGLWFKFVCAILLATSSPAQDLSESGVENYKLVSFANIGFSMANSLGVGTLVTGYSHTPQWITSFSFDPELPLSLIESWPDVLVSANISADAWWLNSGDTTIYDINNRLQFSDLQLQVSVPKIVDFSEIGVSLSGALPLSFAVSAMSRALNRIMAFGAVIGAKWSKGDFSVKYSPSAKVWVHSNEARTIACIDSAEANLAPWPANPINPDGTVDQYMHALVLYRDEERDANGRCRIAGRQSIWTLKNALSASWHPGAHQLSIGLTYYWNFLRPLENRPELAGTNSNSSGLTQAVSGRVAYSYNLPFYVASTLTVGVTSYQGIFSKSGKLLFPFFDFATPSKNQTQIFLELATSI